MADIVGPLLVRAGLITQEQLVKAHQARRQEGDGTLTEHLVSRGALKEDALCAFYRQRLLVPQVGWNELGKVSPGVIKRVPPELAHEFRVVPLAFDREQNLTVAMADPSDSHAVDEIGFFTGAFVMRAVAAPSAIAWALYHYYGITTMLLPKLQARFPEAPPKAASAASPTLIAPEELPAHRPPPPSREQPVVRGSVSGEIPAAKPRTSKPTATVVEPVPTAIDDTPSGSAILVDVPPRERPVTAEPKVIVQLDGPPPPVTLPPPFGQTAKRRAVVVDDQFGGDTPLPPPIPMDITGPIPVDALVAQVPSVVAAATPAATLALEVALAALKRAPDRDSVSQAMVSYLGQVFKRAAFFVQKRGELWGWQGHGGGLHPNELRAAHMSLEKPSTFREILQARLPYRGPVVDAESRDFLIDGLGWAPEQVLVVPLTLRDRVVGLLYGDDEIVPVPDQHVIELARAGANALESILAAKKSL